VQKLNGKKRVGQVNNTCTNFMEWSVPKGTIIPGEFSQGNNSLRRYFWIQKVMEIDSLEKWKIRILYLELNTTYEQHNTNRWYYCVRFVLEFLFSKNSKGGDY
jgi:hypothetical protein